LKFIDLSEKSGEINTNTFLLKLAGGDEQMAVLILNQVKQEIPVEIEKLKKVLVEKNIQTLPAFCHHLISSISPLGSQSTVMKQIETVQKMVSNQETEKVILTRIAALIDELEKTLADLNNNKN